MRVPGSLWHWYRVVVFVLVGSLDWSETGSSPSAPFIAQRLWFSISKWTEMWKVHIHTLHAGSNSFWSPNIPTNNQKEALLSASVRGYKETAQIHKFFFKANNAVLRYFIPTLTCTWFHSRATDSVCYTLTELKNDRRGLNSRSNTVTVEHRLNCKEGAWWGSTGQEWKPTFSGTVISVLRLELFLPLTSLITIKLFIRLISQAESNCDQGKTRWGLTPREKAGRRLRASRHGNTLGEWWGVIGNIGHPFTGRGAMQSTGSRVRDKYEFFCACTGELP